MNSNMTYKRGQVDWAVWRCFASTVVGSPADPPPAFLTRAKRLLEIDRSGDLFDVSVRAPVPFAFSAVAAEGTGNDAAFTAFDAFCLAVAVDLHDAGFKPKEVVFLLRFIRPALVESYEEAIRFPPPDRSPQKASDWKKRGTVRTTLRGSHTEIVDNHIFLLLRKIEMTEVFPSPKRRGSKEGPPAFLEPIFCRGYDALRNELIDLLPHRFNKVMVVEVARLATLVTSFLNKAPEIRRGRT